MGNGARLHEYNLIRRGRSRRREEQSSVVEDEDGVDGDGGCAWKTVKGATEGTREM